MRKTLEDTSSVYCDISIDSSSNESVADDFWDMPQCEEPPRNSNRADKVRVPNGLENVPSKEMGSYCRSIIMRARDIAFAVVTSNGFGAPITLRGCIRLLSGNNWCDDETVNASNYIINRKHFQKSIFSTFFYPSLKSETCRSDDVTQENLDHSRK